MAEIGSRVFTSEEWPEGLRCIDCRREFVEGQPIVERLDCFIDEVPCVEIICAGCDLSGSASPLNPERETDSSSGKGGRPGVGPSDSRPTHRHPLVGYFTDADQIEPAYDPPHDSPCLVCWRPLTATDVRTISLMPAENAVASVFFRVHGTCAEADPAAVEAIERRVIEGEFDA